MPRLIYSMNPSLDGFIAGPDGSFDWSAPDEELPRFHNERVRALGGHVLGRRLYETMVYWETAGEDPSASEHELEFARMWKGLPKIVFSTTLDEVEGNARLARGSLAKELAQAPNGIVSVGGASIAAQCMEQDLIDEFRMFVVPVLLGGGTPYFPHLAAQRELELLESRVFPRAIYQCWGRPRANG